MRVILIHGTAAGTRCPSEPRWWEAHSPFATSLRSALGNGAVQIVDSFLWGNGGANSELARREGGAKLLRDLQRLESDPTAPQYHLVGHSHGGSVIWHALVAACRQRVALNHLQSITTVGTPFLSFSPARTRSVWWLASIMGLFAIATTALPVSAVTSELPALYRESGVFALLAPLITWALLFLLTVSCLFRAIAALRAVISWRLERHFSKEASARYGERLMALWHINDEAMMGLSASTTSAPSLVPRLHSTPWYFRPFNVGFQIFNGFVAPTGDDFAWSTLMHKIQGADVPDLVLTRVSCAPPGMVKAWPPLPRSILAALSADADQQAAAVLKATRARLRKVSKHKQADSAVASLAAQFDWDSVLHTSYFRNADVERLIVGHIQAQAGAGTKCSSDETSDVDRWRTERRLLSMAVHTSLSRDWRLAAAMVGTLALAFIVLTSLFFVSYGQTLYPFTWEAQVATIAARSQEPELATVDPDDPTPPEVLEAREMEAEETRLHLRAYGDNGREPLIRQRSTQTLAGDLLTRLVILGRVSDPGERLAFVLDDTQRAHAIERVAYALGVEKKREHLDRLLGMVKELFPETRRSEVGASVALVGVAGLIRSGVIPPKALVDTLAEAVRTDFAKNVRGAELALPVLFSLGRRAEFDALASFSKSASGDSDSVCLLALNASWNAMVIRRIDSVKATIALCPDTERRKEIEGDLIRKAARLLVDVVVDGLLPSFDEPEQHWAELFSFAVATARHADAARFAEALKNSWLKGQEVWRLDSSEMAWLRSHGFHDLAKSILATKLNYLEPHLRWPDEELLSYARLAKQRGWPDVLVDLESTLRHRAQQPAAKSVDWLLLATLKAVIGGRQSADNELREALARYDRSGSKDWWSPKAIPKELAAELAPRVRQSLTVARSQALGRSTAERGADLLSISERYLQTGDPYRARVVAELSARPSTIVRGYLKLLDAAINRRDPSLLRRHGLDDDDDRPHPLAYSAP